QVVERREARNVAREHWLDLRAQRLEGMAAELATGLVDGADCPVCGAVEHPRPAVHEGPGVTAADEQAARKAADAAEAALGTVTATLEQQERELAALRARAGTIPVAEQAAALPALTATAAETATTAAGLAAAE